METLSNLSQKSEVRYPSRELVETWIEILIKLDFPYLPPIDGAWVDDVMPCFEVTRMNPECRSDLHEAAASVLYKVIKNHRRYDGNKRSSIICMELLYLVNGTRLDCSSKEIEDLALRIASSEGNSETIVLPEVKDFLRIHTAAV